jgi:signal transduction histidine kinase
MNSQHDSGVRAFARRIPGLARLRTRLLMLVLLALIPVIGLVVYTATEQRSAAIVEARASALRLVRLAASGQKQHIEAARQLLATLAQLSEVRQTNSVACEQLFTNLLTLHRVYANIGIIGPDGYLVASGVPMRRMFLGDRAFFIRARDTGKFTIGDYRVGRVTRRPTVELGYPIRREDGRFGGVIFAAFDLTWLNQLIAHADLPDRSSLTAIDRSGTVILRYPDRQGRHPGDSVKDLPAISRILHGNAEGTFRDSQFDGVTRIYAYTPLSRADALADSWVLVGIPSESALAPAYRTLAINLSYLGFVMLLALTAAWYGGDFFILRKVRALVGATRRVAEGDLKARTHTAYDAGELGQLAHAFDEMADSLEQRVAERQRAEAELKVANESLELRVAKRTTELKRSNEELEQFAYVASHDLQEPLRMIASYMQLLKQRYGHKLDSDATEFMAFALDGAERMQRLIVDLLTYSRVGSKAKPLVPTDMNDILERAMRNLTVAIEETGAKVNSPRLPVVPGDSVQLTQLFQNLIGNAIKFRSERPPEIHIAAQQEPGSWHFTVSDNGIGIPKKDFDRIFIIFQRLHTREKYPGTGIGLAICKKIVERHGGRIWVESEEGKGTTFHFVLLSEPGTQIF